MAPHFVYVLVASEKDMFAEMASVSAATLRETTPGARITILSDTATRDLQSPAIKFLDSIADNWICEAFAQGSGLERSRRLKLTCRGLVEGDFVYLDCDTLIARDLTPLARHSGDFSAVRDIGEPLPPIQALVGEKDWTLPAKRFNSGVLGLRDTPRVHAMFKDALALWEEAAAGGVYFDQLAFWLAVERAALPVTWLASSFNAQITMKSYAANRPHVFHGFSLQFAERDTTVLHVLAKQLKTDGLMDRGLLATFIETGNPWTRLSRPGQYVALGRPVGAAAAALRLLLKTEKSVGG
ncbi:hypothetical protein [Hyphococcus sp.]|uniref:hypothetical protein n=1 Tax=Hyphococcus sp. TaxID=2038636 RepID=UPI003D11AFC4